MRVSRNAISKAAPQFWILACFLALVFMTGGASRIDVQSLIILRPISVFVLAVGFLTLKKQHLRGRHWLVVGFLTTTALALSHVIPLPPAIWQALPGRTEAVVVERLAELDGIWRPLTLAPANGWHAILSLVTPFAILVLGVQLCRDDLRRLLPLIICLGAASGLLGLLQAISDPYGPFYFYRITNNGAAVGLFANRNHAATLLACLFPLLAVYASIPNGSEDQIKSRQLFMASIGIVLIPLILVTGSRSGLISTVIALLISSLLYRSPPTGYKVRRGAKRKSIGPLPLLIIVVVVCLGFVTYYFSRAVAIERLFEEPTQISRSDFWSVSLQLFWKYFPWGSGSGSFVEAFLIAEPMGQLDENYLNRAHNDWLETAVTFGMPGIVVLVTSLILFMKKSYVVWVKMDPNRGHIALARAATAVVGILALASLSDYPLRTPIMMSVLTVSLLWLTEVNRSRVSETAAQGGS